MIMGDYASQNIGEYQNVYINLDLSNIYELEFAPPRRTWGNRGGIHLGNEICLLGAFPRKVLAAFRFHLAR